MDWRFWIEFFVIGTPAFLGGWMTRGMIERENAWDEREARARMARSIEQAKQRHPAYKGERL